MTRMFIEDMEIDLYKGFTNQATYAIDDLNNIDSKATPYSRTIILPGTARNNQLLGNIFEFNNSNLTNDALNNVGYNFNASRQAKCRIEENGLTQIKGVFRLLEIIIDGKAIEYECAVFGELGGFVAKLGNQRLEDIDFSAYDHEYNIINILASWDNHNSGAGYYYPLIDYGGESTGAFGIAKHDYQYKTFRPALHLREYIDKIITGAGYTWESNFFNTDFFKRQIIPNNQKALFIPKNQLFYTTGSPSYILNDSISAIETKVTEDFVSINSFVGGLFTTSDNKEFTYTGTSADLSFNILLGGNFSLSGLSFPDKSSISISLQIFKNGNLEYSNGQTFGRNGAGTGLINWTVSPVISLTTGDIFDIHITTTVIKSYFGGVPVNYSVNINSGSFNIDSAVPVLSPAELGDTIRFNEIHPKNIFQKDFFTSILKAFYLMVTEDPFRDRHLVIEPWIEFFKKDPSTFIDWSDKLDRSHPIRIKPMSEINARYYELKFKQDNDFYNEEYRKKYSEGYGDRVFDNGFDFAKESEKVELIFAATVLVGYEGEDKVTPAIFKKSNNLEDKIEHVIRIMQAKKITGVSSWNIMQGASILSTNTDYPYAGHLDDPDAPNADINFGVPKQLFFALVSGNLGNNLFNSFYSEYFAEITDKDSRLLTARVKLNDIDIHQLDFSRFIYVDGGLYRLCKIKDYEIGNYEPAGTELLRVVNTTY